MKFEISSIANCFPFAPKYCHLDIQNLLGEIRLKSKSDCHKSIPNLPLILGADLDFLNQSKSFDENFLTEECIKYSKEEIKRSGSLSVEHIAQVNDFVNFWDGDDKDWFDEDDETDDANGQQIPIGAFQVPANGVYITTDALASYKPAHFFEFDKYGISFLRDQFVKSVCGYISRQNIADLKLKNDLYILIIYHVFAHEVCHSWVEDIVSMVDCELGNKKDTSNFYSTAHNHYRGFIAREEAVCETAAYGWVHDCLQKSKYTKDSTLTAAYEKWIEDSVDGLPGYSNYCSSVKQAPIESQTFIKGLAKLISSRYLKGNHSELCRKVIESYFGAKNPATGCGKGSNFAFFARS